MESSQVETSTSILEHIVFLHVVEHGEVLPVRPQLSLILLSTHVVLTGGHHHVLETGIERGHSVTVNIGWVVDRGEIKSIAWIIFNQSRPVWVHILLVATLASLDACGGKA